MSSDIYFNFASWFPGNVHVKPYFNTQFPMGIPAVTSLLVHKSSPTGRRCSTAELHRKHCCSRTARANSPSRLPLLSLILSQSYEITLLPQVFLNGRSLVLTLEEIKIGCTMWYSKVHICHKRQPFANSQNSTFYKSKLSYITLCNLLYSREF